MTAAKSLTDSFVITAIPPFRLDLTAWALRRRALNQIDRWDGSSYKRALLVASKPVEVTVTQIGPQETGRLHVHVTGTVASRDDRAAIKRALRRLLGLDCDLSPFYAIAQADSKLCALANRFRGMKPPRFLSLFETLVNAIACQQISLDAGLTLINRLAAAYGRTPESGSAVGPTFPAVEDIAQGELSSLRALGFSRHKGLAILDLATRLAGRQTNLDALSDLDDQGACEELVKLRGVGRWSAEYLLLRGLGRIHVFPGDDVGARNNLQRWLELRDALDYDGTMRIVTRWYPYAGLVYMHLLLRGLADRGLISTTSSRP